MQLYDGKQRQFSKPCTRCGELQKEQQNYLLERSRKFVMPKAFKADVKRPKLQMKGHVILKTRQAYQMSRVLP